MASEADLDRILAKLLADEDEGIPFDETVLIGLPVEQMVAVAEFLTDHRELLNEFAKALQREWPKMDAPTGA